jgi:hypothetical protein
LFSRPWFEKIHLYPCPVQVKVDDEEKNKQEAIWQMNPTKENKDFLFSISLTKTRDCLNEHDYKKNGINDFKQFCFHSN